MSSQIEPSAASTVPASTVPATAPGSTAAQLDRWAYVTLGELPQAMDGSLPIGEFALLRREFTPVISMTDWIGDVTPEVRTAKLGSTAEQVKFSIHALRVIFRNRKRLKGVYCSEEFPGFYLTALLCLILRKLPLVVLVHNVGSKKRRIPLQIPPFRNRINVLLCLSETSRDQLANELKVKADRLRVIGSRVDETFYKPVPDIAPDTDPLIVSAGAVNRDYETLVKACEQLGVRCFIAAGSNWAHTLGNQKFDLKGERLTVQSAGSVALREQYRKATAVVVPLHDTGYASGQTVILEAMACGKAVITSDIRGRSDFIDDGVNGFYVKPGDPDALAAIIRTLIDDPERCAAVGAQARRTIEEKYSVGNYVARIEHACADAQR